MPWLVLTKNDVITVFPNSPFFALQKEDVRKKLSPIAQEKGDGCLNMQCS